MLKQQSQRVFGHMGAIFFNLTAFGVILSIAALVTQFLWLMSLVVFLVILLIPLLFTLFTLLASPEYRAFASKGFEIFGSDKFAAVTQGIADSIPLIIGLTTAFLLLSICFLSLDIKNKESKVRLIIVGVSALIFIVSIICNLTLGGNA